MGDTAAATPTRRFGRICVFCGSNSGNRPVFGDAALELGQGLVTREIDLVYGGGSVGLMGLIAQTVLDGGCRVLGVIPRALMPLEISGASVGEVKIVSDMHERKAEMARQSDAFIALPGGYGTMEELLEMITWSQLGIHDKPVGLLNVDGYYDPLLALFDKGAAEGFIKADCRQIIVSAPTAHELLTKMEQYTRSHLEVASRTSWEGKSRKRRSSASSGEEEERERKKRREKKESRRISRVSDEEEEKRRRKKKHGDRGKDKERDSKEKRSKEKEKSKRKDKDPDFKEISKDDYFAKSNEFATWLKEEKGKYFSDLSSESARDIFLKFVKQWNKGKLPSQYYQGITTGPRSAHKWNIKA